MRDRNIVAAPMKCDGCGEVVYVKPERLRDDDDPLTCDEHGGEALEDDA